MSIMAETSSLKSHRFCGKVRIIGKIRGFADRESSLLSQDSKPWITVKKPDNGSSEKCRVFFDVQSSSREDTYELDYCYEQDEDIGLMYSREIKPLVSDIFYGRNATVVALGAKGSGKTYTIQGSQEKPGLVVMAMSEIISKAAELRKSVSVSLYELTQDRAYDLLDHKHPEIQVLEDANGKINLKGLSQVSVKSISDFQNVYFSKGGLQKHVKTPANQQSNHKGLVVYVSTENDKSKAKIENKIHFVDLAGYEDPKIGGKNGFTIAESNRTNKSLYTLLNVVTALNAKDTRPPYRESKLTRILQDSLGGTSNVLLVTCLNDCFCQNTISSINLVCRSYRTAKLVLTDSTNRSQRSDKVKVFSSLKCGKPMPGSWSSKKKVGGHSVQFSEKKSMNISKGRKLFAEENRTNSKQVRCHSEDTSNHKSKILAGLAVVTPFSLEEALLDGNVSAAGSKEENVRFEGNEFKSMPELQDGLLLCSLTDKKVGSLDEKDISPRYVINQIETTQNVNPGIDVMQSEASTCEMDTVKESIMPYEMDNGSTPLSEQIREISNNLKLLYSSTPLSIQTQQEGVGAPSNGIVEPQTPVSKIRNATHCSPHGTFGNQSSGVKQSIVREYLKFLNSASKEELKSIKGIGEKRATYILELREESPEPFKSLDNLQDIGLSAKQIQEGMVKKLAGDLFK